MIIELQPPCWGQDWQPVSRSGCAIQPGFEYLQKWSITASLVTLELSYDILVVVSPNTAPVQIWENRSREIYLTREPSLILLSLISLWTKHWFFSLGKVLTFSTGQGQPRHASVQPSKEQHPCSPLHWNLFLALLTWFPGCLMDNVACQPPAAFSFK